VRAARVLSALTGGAARRPLLVVAIAALLGLGCAGFALRLHPTAAADTLVGRSSADYQATQRFYKQFGVEPVAVLVKGNLQQLVLSSDIDRLLGLEGCLSGNVPPAGIAKEGGPHGPCGQLAATHPVKVVLGPGTFINEAALQINSQLSSQSSQAQAQAKQAEQVVYKEAIARKLGAAQARKLSQQAGKATLAGFEASVATLALQYGLNAAPSIDDPNFVSTLVFGNTVPAGTPKQRFAYLFPSSQTALISVRMKADLSERQRTHTVALIRQAVAMAQWRLTHGESYLVTGEPAVVSDLTSSITHSVLLLLVAVLLVMAGALSLIFAGRPRLLPLAVALLAAALTFGALAASGASLTMASIAVLPVLIGLAVDYSIQFQSRVEEALVEQPGDRVAAVRRAATLGAPTIATAGAASIGGLLVLLLSPVPMVRGFGLLLIAGIVLAFLCAVTVGSAVLVLAGRDRGAIFGRAPALGGAAGAGAGVDAGAGSNSLFAGAASAWGAPLTAAWRGARELLLDNRATRFVIRVALVHAVRRPGRVLAVGLALAAVGWGLDTQTRVETDITKLVPQNLASLQNLNTLQRLTGVGGEVDLTVNANDLTQPKVIKWMGSYEQSILKRFHYSATRGCGKAQLCPAFSLPDLFQSASATQADVRGVLGAIPRYFSQGVISSNHRVGTIAFGIRLMSLAQQQQLIDQMRARLHPPAGVKAQLVGLQVLAARANASAASPWRRMLGLLIGLVAVALVLLLAFRGDRRRTLVPLVPIVLATGWSALVLFAVRVPLNPMSVTLGALVLAISTEFSVLLSERHRQERIAGYDMTEALRRCYRHTGAAVAASGVTAIAGFGVLALSDIRMLRDFGVVTLIDLTAALLGVLVVLPAALTLAEHGELTGLPVRWIAGLRLRRPALPNLRRRGRARHEPI
jgi:uncharacterized protein